MEGWQIKTSETEPASELGFEFTEGGWVEIRGKVTNLIIRQLSHE